MSFRAVPGYPSSPMGLTSFEEGILVTIGMGAVEVWEESASAMSRDDNPPGVRRNSVNSSRNSTPMVRHRSGMYLEAPRVVVLRV